MSGISVSNVENVLDQFAAAFRAKDVDAVMALMSDDADLVVVGTGADEIRIGPQQVREQVERDLSQADKIEFDVGPARVSARGDVAWAFAEPTVIATVGGEQIRMPMRWTLILVTSDGDLRIHSTHLSVAFGGQEPGQSFGNA